MRFLGFVLLVLWVAAGYPGGVATYRSQKEAGKSEAVAILSGVTAGVTGPVSTVLHYFAGTL
jgi:hypothetical protein